MERSTPYQRNAPTVRLKCIASGSRPLAKSFTFGEVVGAVWSQLNHCVLTDGSALFLLTVPEGKEDKVRLNQTYVFKNLVRRDNRAYFNENTSCFRSYDIATDRELVERAAALLLPPSTDVNSIADAPSAPELYVTLKGEVTSMAAIRQVRQKGVPIPIRDLKMRDGTGEVLVSLWRESALAAISQGDWVKVTHLRKPATPSSYGFKWGSSAYSTVTKIQPAVVQVEVTIVGVEVGEVGARIMTECGRELVVPVWQGTEEEFVERLPLRLTLELEGEVVASPQKLFEEDFESLFEGEDDGEEAFEGALLEGDDVE